MALACDSTRKIPELGVDDRVVCCTHENGVGFGGARGRGLEVVSGHVYGGEGESCGGREKRLTRGKVPLMSRLLFDPKSAHAFIHSLTRTHTPQKKGFHLLVQSCLAGPDISHQANLDCARGHICG